MKKPILALSSAFLLCISTAHAQKKSSPDGITFGIRMGVNFQNVTGKDNNGDKLNNDIKTGYHLGANVELPVTDQIYIQPGLLFSAKGAKYNSDGATGSTGISYIEMPVNIIYKSEMGSGKLFGGLGPYLAYGIGGKLDYKGNGVDVSKNIQFKNSVTLADYIANFGAYLKPLDYGVNFLAGYELSNNLSAQLNFQLGLAKINPQIEGLSGSKATAKNMGFGLSVGYRF